MLHRSLAARAAATLTSFTQISAILLALVFVAQTPDASAAEPVYIGRTFSGPHAYPGPLPPIDNKTLGGYFIVDATEVPYYVSDSSGNEHIKYGLGLATGAFVPQLDPSVKPVPTYTHGSYGDAYRDHTQHIWTYVNGNEVESIITTPGDAYLGFDSNTGSSWVDINRVGNVPNTSATTPLSSVVNVFTGSTTKFDHLETSYGLESDHLTYQTFTAHDVFFNPKTLSEFHPTVSRDGYTVVSTFAPHIMIGGVDVPMPLSDVAHLFGVHHFNWVQHVQYPSQWTVQVDNGTTVSPPVVGPLLDPITTPPSNYQLTNQNGDTWPIRAQFTPDLQDYYYNEKTGGSWDVNQFTQSGFTLTFGDQPSTPAIYNLGLLNTTFKTELVGVDLNGNPKPTGLEFTWKSNTVSIGSPEWLPVPINGGVTIMSGTSNTGLEYVGGGITDVEFAAPEPSTIALTSMWLVGLIVAARRRTRACPIK